MGKVLQFPTRPELIEPDPDEIAIVEARPVVDPRPRRVTHLGTVHAALLRARRRTWFEITHVPRRCWRLIRYFLRGMIGHRDKHGEWVGGWLGLLMWCLALREREDARAVADENPGKQLNATQKADRIAVWHAGVVVVPHVAAGVAADHYLGVWWLALIPLVVGTIIYGWRTDPRPPGPLVPYQPGDVNGETMTAALRAVNLLVKPTDAHPNPEGVTTVRLPSRVGGGEEIEFELPKTVKASAAQVIDLKAEIAASLQIPFHQLDIEPGEHPGRIVVWHGRHDPFSGTPAEHPLLRARRWSVFDPVPVGLDARSRRVSAPLIGTNWLIGGAPGTGKTSAARSVAAAMAMDPDCDAYVFDAKGGKDWSAMRIIAVQYESGPIPEQAARLLKLLEELREEADRRFQFFQTLPDDECPDSSLTPEITSRHGIRPIGVFLDEAHEFVEDDRYGKEITRWLARDAKRLRAAGIFLVFITQDPDAALQERFSSLRRVLKTRLSMKVMDWLASDMILGAKMAKRGWDASEIEDYQVGTGILRADLEVDGSTRQPARMIRTYYMDNPAWRAVCETGAALRAGRVETPAEIEPVADEWLTATVLLDRFRECAPEALPAAVTHPKALGEWLTSRGVPAERNGAGERVRSRLAVELATGLPRGCLEVDDAVSIDAGPTVDRRPVDGASTTPVTTPVEV